MFPEGLDPFYAGFGNRETDAISYRYLGIPLNKNFIINTSSEVIQLGKTYKTTYQEIADNADIDFPKISKQNQNDIIEKPDIKSKDNLIDEDNNSISKLHEDGNTISVKIDN